MTARTYSPATMEWFLAGYDTGHHVGDTAGHRRGYLEGHDAGIARGRELEREDFARSLQTQHRALVADLPRRLDAIAYRRHMDLAGEVAW